MKFMKGDYHGEKSRNREKTVVGAVGSGSFVDVAGNPGICGIRRKPARRKGSIGRHVRDMEKPRI
jgi:hypothetical protein